MKKLIVLLLLILFCLLPTWTEEKNYIKLSFEGAVLNIGFLKGIENGTIDIKDYLRDVQSLDLIDSLGSYSINDGISKKSLETTVYLFYWSFSSLTTVHLKLNTSGALKNPRGSESDNVDYTLTFDKTKSEGGFKDLSPSKASSLTSPVLISDIAGGPSEYGYIKVDLKTDEKSLLNLVGGTYVSTITLTVQSD